METKKSKKGKMNFKTSVHSIVILSLIVCCGACFASMQQSVAELLKLRKYTGGGIGIVIKDLGNDSVVVSINPDTLLNPASVAKLVTGTAALELLGLDFLHLTRVYIDGKFNSDSGVINGNLYIKGFGDPGFSAERLWLFVQHLRHRGIKAVRGNLVLDDFFFDSVSVGPGFSEEDGSRAYQSLISALPVSFSAVGIHHRPGQDAGSPVHVDMFPKIEGVRISSSAKTVDGSRGRLDVSTSLSSGATQILVRGNMAINEKPRYTYRRVWQTWETFGGALRAQCTESDLRIAGKTVRAKVPDSLIAKGPFYIFDSEPMPVFIGHMFKWSSNFVSEMLFKTMGAKERGEPGTWPKGVSAVSNWWEKRGLPAKLEMANGSGMGDVNRISAAQVTELLAYVSKQKNYYPDFIAALPAAGIDGTLKTRFNRSKLKGRVRAKTGTLNSLKVSTLAGYLFLDDKTYAFTIILNDAGTGQFDNWIMQEEILELIANKQPGVWNFR
ncbi:MAG: D-alanyl-D-alanine carboxypeptidase/D-alanyl-D-alanine-endopeptidase [Chitinispirillales bacterium]|jgi:D-alanyl-D-alanine carboxypeptidase/D-alanyl-D-alanine-endopeptidase (penicillin-binding protein 4)|nr:D-alanyl-D-alanine carboxypeptidase/D-alanyl-D-alanine-endopeptidase [Chitinispirillales bacterium]